MELLNDKFGFLVLDHSPVNASKFWATITGAANTPFTIRADRMDLEDFALQLDEEGRYLSIKQFFKDLSPESWTGFIYLFVDHLIQNERNKVGAEIRLKLAVIGRIFELINTFTGDPTGEFFTFQNFKIAGYTLNIFARRAEENENYKNEFGNFKVWIESDQITDLDTLLKCYADIVINTILRQSKN